MSFERVGRVMQRDLRVGPRSPLVLWVIALPILMTVVVRVVFGGLFDQAPSLGLTGPGAAEVADLAQLDGVDVEIVDDEDALRRKVEAHDLDAGWVVPAGFATAAQAGDIGSMDLLVSGDSYASDRTILALAVTDVALSLAPESASPVSVDVVPLGETGTTTFELSERFLPLLVIMAVAVAGVFIPAGSLVDEKTSGTLRAVLVTPVSLTELLVAKAGTGVLFAIGTGAVTLIINGAFGDHWAVMLLAVVVGAVMMAEIGLMLGSWARDTNTMFAAWKSGAIILIFPVLFYLFPGLPQWIAKLGPTYYVIQPVFALAVEGAGPGDVIGELLIAVAFTVALAPLVIPFARRLQRTAANT